MKPKEEIRLVWRGWLMLTAISCLAFGVFIRKIDGSAAHSAWFFIAGLIALGIWLILVNKGSASEKHKPISPSKN